MEQETQSHAQWSICHVLLMLGLFAANCVVWSGFAYLAVRALAQGK